jgi:hypothetical protein
VQFRQTFLAATELFVLEYLRLIRGARFGREFEARACRHAVGCLLARVVGRSPFEYLTDPERERQKRMALRFVAKLPQRLLELIQRFEEE